MTRALRNTSGLAPQHLVRRGGAGASCATARTLMAINEGAAGTASFAATYPEQVSALVRFTRGPDEPAAD